jgi:putative addiction module component (TIGR02574 family)
MSPTMEALGINQLSVAQRILLVEEIWDTMAVEAEQIRLTAARKRDLRRCLASSESNRHAGSTWEEVKSRLQ